MPDVDIETFEAKYSEGNWTDRRLAKEAGVERATIRNLRRHKRSSRETLKRVAKPLGVTADCLIHHPKQDRRYEPDPLSEDYKDLLRSVLHSEAYADYARANGGMFEANFLAYVYQVKAPELDSLNLSPNGRIKVHEDLCRDGLLEKHEARSQEDGTQRVIYCCRTWSREQAEDNLDLRTGIEILAAERAIRLMERNPKKYQEIRDELKRLLDLMAEIVVTLRKRNDEMLARHALVIDSKFHKAWAGDAPDYRAATSRAVFGHGQIVHRYISQMRIAASDKNAPANMPTLASLAVSSYEDLVEIHAALVAVELSDVANREEKKATLLELINQHPRNNWNRVAEIERFNNRSR